MNMFQKAAFAVQTVLKVKAAAEILKENIDREIRFTEQYVGEGKNFIEGKCKVVLSLNGNTFTHAVISKSYAKIPFNSIEWNKELSKYLEEIKKLPYEQLTLQQKKVAKWYTFDLKKLSRIEIFRELNSDKVIIQIAKKSEPHASEKSGFVTDRKNVK